MSIEQRLRIILAITLVSGVVSIVSIILITKGAQLNHMNVQYNNSINEFSQALNYTEANAPSIIHILDKLYKIKKQTDRCQEMIQPLDRIVMRLIKTDMLITLCEKNRGNVSTVISQLEQLFDTKQRNYVIDEHTHDMLINVPDRLKENSYKFELLVEQSIAFTIKVALWFITPFFILVFLLIYTIIKNVNRNAIQFRETANALSKIEIENMKLAYYDNLTELPNRNLLIDRLSQTFKLSKRNNSQFALLFLDLDGFKNINDTLGHAAGDMLIQQAAIRIKNTLRKSDTLARFGGDEFVIILPGIHKPIDASTIAKKIVSTISEPFKIEHVDSYVTASIGIAIYPENGEDTSILMKHADIAMYHSKNNGKNNYNFYNNEINEISRKRLSLERELRKSLDNDELFLHYQPVVDLDTGYIAGVEALLRWHNGEQGLVSPAEFIPVAEDTGLIVDIGYRVIDLACKQCQIWRETSAPNLHVAINVSSRQLREEFLVDYIEKSLMKYNLPVSAIDIEITENTFYTDDKFCINNLHKLNELGLRLLLDDFGTGYSSLSTLHTLPFDIIKIDRSFLNLDTGKNKMITGTIIDMAENFDMQVVAEGIETPETLEFLQQRGCKYGQGYLFKKPLPVAELDLSENFYSKINEVDSLNLPRANIV